MKRRIASLLMILALCLMLAVPTMAGGVISRPYFSSGSGMDLLDESGSGEGWSFDVTTNTLTLNGLDAKGLAIYNTKSPLIIELVGSNTLTALFETEDTAGVIITGSGSLTSKGELYITVDGDCTVTGSGSILLDTESRAIGYPASESIGRPWNCGLENAIAVGKDGQPLAAQNVGCLMRYVDGAGNTAAYAKITAAGSAEPAQPEPNNVSAFTDVSADAYYAKAAAWAKENGMTSGDTFSPDSPCTREMAVEFMWKRAGSPQSPVKAGFTDVSSDAVNWAVESGVTQGTSETTFSPDQTCTRAQIVTFLYRAFA